jgi:Flp pilus assembly protein TadG
VRSLFHRVKQRRKPALAAGEDGSALIELAVTLPALFALLFCFMEMCLAFYSYDMISDAARQGTRYAMFRGTSCTTASGSSCTVTATQVNTFVSGLSTPNSAAGTISVNTTFPSGNEATGSLVKVQVTYTFPIKMPFVPSNSLTLVSTSETTIVD